MHEVWDSSPVHRKARSTTFNAQVAKRITKILALQVQEYGLYRYRCTLTDVTRFWTKSFLSGHFLGVQKYLLAFPPV